MGAEVSSIGSWGHHWRWQELERDADGLVGLEEGYCVQGVVLHLDVAGREASLASGFRYDEEAGPLRLLTGRTERGAMIWTRSKPVISTLPQ